MIHLSSLLHTLVGAKQFLKDANLATARFEIASNYDQAKWHARHCIKMWNGVSLRSGERSSPNEFMVCESDEALANAMQKFFPKSEESPLQMVLFERIVRGTSHNYLVDFSQNSFVKKPQSEIDDIKAKHVEEKIIKPLVEYLKVRNISFEGRLKVNFIWEKGEPIVTDLVVVPSL